MAALPNMCVCVCVKKWRAVLSKYKADVHEAWQLRLEKDVVKRIY